MNSAGSNKSAAAEYDVVIIGAGLAGITAALELLDAGLRIALIDRDSEAELGGLAKESFGGMTLVGTPIQKRHKIHDTPEIALRDWLRFGGIEDPESWPARWAELYVHRSLPDIHDWLDARGIRFFPLPHWVERGLDGDGNSLPRYHIVWGTGARLMEVLIATLKDHPRAARLTMFFDHRVERLRTREGRVTGCGGIREDNSEPFQIQAGETIIASGGINGDIERVKAEWDRDWGRPPRHILNGAHRYADGRLHDAVEAIDGAVVDLHQMWNYAAGIHAPRPRIANEGLSLIPPRSALWLDANGRRFGLDPLVTGFDTHEICKRIATDPHGYSWQLMNRRILLREVAISGAAYNPAFRQRSYFRLLKDILFGNKNLYRYLLEECEDVVVADNLEELAAAMNRRNANSSFRGSGTVTAANLRESVEEYDRQIDAGADAHRDPQLRRLAELRQWKGDRSRTCAFQKIIDPRALPLIAIREFIVSRKSMGGIRTDLHSRVLANSGEPIPGLYAAGESAGFGGGGISGLKSLEGTFISSCILNARMAVRAILGKPLTP